VISDVVWVLLLVLALLIHGRRYLKRERAAMAAAERNQLGTDGPKAQHPHIDITQCIGCGACVDVCPEGDVLAVIGGKAALVNGHKCIGHGLCADVCPVGAIEIVMAPPTVSADTPYLTEEMETNLPGLFVVGELGGLALIKNAVNQGRICIDTIATRLAKARVRGPADLVDVCVVGAGPAGLSASLRAVERKLSCTTLEQDELGGTVSKYPRQKLVMTSPVEFPLHGTFKKLEISKESLLAFWSKVVKESGLNVRTKEPVEQIQAEADTTFTVKTAKGSYRARCVILAIGRRGTPRKLGVPGEELPKVMYSLLDAEAYEGQRILVVGGGDSAVEAAMGLAHQKGNRVTLSYRREAFSRLKDRNEKRIEECIKKRQIEVVFNSHPVQIYSDRVTLEAAGQRRDLPNDYIWVFAGGTPPNAFLQKIGVQLGPCDLTELGQAEARQVA
jgi:thioredoxin reductase (NADPH)